MVAATLPQQSIPVGGTVTVRYGSYLLGPPVAGWAVQRVKRALRDRWSIPFFAAARRNGVPTPVEAVLRTGDRLEFVLWPGSKAADRSAGPAAHAVVVANPDLMRIVTDTLALGLDTRPSVEAAVAAAVRYMEQRFGEPAPADFPAVREVLDCIAHAVERIANRLDPPPADIVDTPWVAERLGCTTTWIADMARRGELPDGCVVTGTGHGKPWKFYRARIESWLATR